MALIKAILKFQSTTSVPCRSTSTIACANNNTSSSFSPLLNFSSAASIEAEKAVTNGPRYDWTRPQIQSVYDSPLMDLLFHGAQVHRHSHKFREVQQCTLLSIKTGGCSENCSYCPQSSRYDTGVKAQKLMTKDEVIQAAKRAKEAGSTRFCMGAAWRDTVGRKTNFNQILDYVKEIRFSLDGTPVRVFKNNENVGVAYPKNQGMRIYSSLWNTDDWATRGGLVKIDWSKALFVASYQSFNAQVCSTSSSDCSANAWYNQAALDSGEQQQLEWVRKNYMVYDYCSDTKRFPLGLPTECTR